MTLRKDADGRVLCSDCGSRVQDKWSLGGFVAVLRTLDVFAWVMAGVFFILGFFWPPGFIIAVLALGFGLFKAIMRRPRYACLSCKRTFTYEETT